MKFIKNIKISEFRENDRIDDIFFVKFKKGVNTYAKGFYFDLTLADSSGNIEYKYWGGPDEGRIRNLYESIKPDSIVHVQGKIGEYKGRLQFTTNEPFLFEVLKPEQYNDGDFVKVSQRDLEEMYLEILEYIELVENAQIKKLLTTVFHDKEFENRFKKHPGAIEIHHNWVGGLMEHVLQILKYCKTSWEIFPLNKDLLIMGALLHDVGKLEEIQVTSRIKGTNRGQLTGHLILSSVFVSKKCDEFLIDNELKDKIMHMIVSHHGKLEYGTVKEPMFPEALTLYLADESSSKIAEMIEFIENARQGTEDDFMFNKRSGKNILLK
ncbi:MAG TPA: HD domain-containing protein [Candidatus Nanoarchaeia archaeon]|nr:HD domain-containing protein [Candidatus Nanoarchaeia archaeon]